LNLEMVNLVKLQKLDREIERIERIRAEGPERMAAVDAELAAVQQRVDQSMEREQELLKRRRDLESEVDDTDEKIKANQGRQLQAKTNEEYRALLKEADYLRKSNTAREDELLQIMEELESLTEENKQLAEALEQQKVDSETKKKEIQEWLKESLKDSETLTIDRESLVRDVPKEHIALYTKVYAGRNGRAVVPIVDGICQECHLQIPPQAYNELQRNETLVTCPHCLRIIYWKDHEDYSQL
jgi:predicted  nucleic acid-binding Zn-ribbon protein